MKPCWDSCIVIPLTCGASAQDTPSLFQPLCLRLSMACHRAAESSHCKIMFSIVLNSWNYIPISAAGVASCFVGRLTRLCHLLWTPMKWLHNPQWLRVALQDGPILRGENGVSWSLHKQTWPEIAFTLLWSIIFVSTKREMEVNWVIWFLICWKMCLSVSLVLLLHSKRAIFSYS